MDYHSPHSRTRCARSASSWLDLRLLRAWTCLPAAAPIIFRISARTTPLRGFDTGNFTVVLRMAAPFDGVEILASRDRFELPTARVEAECSIRAELTSHWKIDSVARFERAIVFTTGLANQRLRPLGYTEKMKLKIERTARVELACTAWKAGA